MVVYTRNSEAKGKIRAAATDQHTIRFPVPTDDRFIRLVVTNAVSAGGQPIAAIGELDVLVKD